MDLLDALASRSPAPGAGAAAALTAASAAALVGMVARSSDRLDGAAAIVREADDLRHRAVELIDEDGRRYAEVLAAEPHREADPDRFAAALAAANEPPAAVVAIGVRARELGAVLVGSGNPRLRGDATAAGILGDAAAATALELVRLNTAYGALAGEVLSQARQRYEDGRHDLGGTR